MRRLAGTLLSLGLFAGSAPSAVAHIHLRYPPTRTEEQKDGPCGAIGSVRGPAITLEAGATIEVAWDETIEHPGHFRVSFDTDGQDFINPVSGDEVFAETVVEVEDRVVDGDLGPGDDGYLAQVTLPDVECENCTLQLMQVMSTTPPFAEADLYYQCADITLVAAAGGDSGGEGGGEGGGGEGEPQTDEGDRPAGGTVTSGCAAGGPAGPAALSLLGLALLLVRRRA